MINMEGLIYDKTLHTRRNGRIYLNAPDLNKEKVYEIGRKYLKLQKVAIAGAIRDAERNLPQVKTNIRKMTSLAKNHSILIVENDSRDNTRKVLLQWKKDIPHLEVLGCKKESEPCRIKMKNDHKPGGRGKNEFSLEGWRTRVELMAKLRNFYVDRALALKSDFLISYEMDLSFDLPNNHMEKAFYLFNKFPHIDSICSYCLNDHGTAWDVCTIVFPPISRWQTFVQSNKHAFFVEDLARFKDNEQPLKVLSCFGGIAIYRVSSMIKFSARYGSAPAGTTTCEHNMLSYKLENNYIVPSMKFKITKNWSMHKK